MLECCCCCHYCNDPTSTPLSLCAMADGLTVVGLLFSHNGSFNIFLHIHSMAWFSQSNYKDKRFSPCTARQKRVGEYYSGGKEISQIPCRITIFRFGWTCKGYCITKVVRPIDWRHRGMNMVTKSSYRRFRISFCHRSLIKLRRAVCWD